MYIQLTDICVLFLQAIQAAKADMVRERRERAEKQKDIRAMSLRDRRKAKKSEDAAARRAI